MVDASHVFFIQSSLRGHLGCFHVLAIVNSGVTNTEVHPSLQTSFFSFLILSRYLEGVAGSYGSSSRIFWRKFVNIHWVN